MEKIVIDLSKNTNDPTRIRRIPLTKEELEDATHLRQQEKDIEDEQINRNEKFMNLVDKMATQLDVNRDELVELFGIEANHDQDCQVR